MTTHQHEVFDPVKDISANRWSTGVGWDQRSGDVGTLSVAIARQWSFVHGMAAVIVDQHDPPSCAPAPPGNPGS